MFDEGTPLELSCYLGGLNYSGHLNTYRMAVLPGGTPQDYVTAALGAQAVIRDVQKVTPEDMVYYVEQCVRWVGGEGAYLSPESIESSRFQELIVLLVDYLATAAKPPATVQSFSFAQGHPRYQVLWDFAYLIVSESQAELFLGSSSD